MISYLSRVVRSQRSNASFFNPMPSRVKYFPTLLDLRRTITTQRWEFTDSNRGIVGVYHHTINAEKTDQNPEKLAEAIHNTITSHTDSLFFLTEKSRLLRRSDNNPNDYLPLQEHEFTNIKLMIELITKQWLRPRAGHTCMAITDEVGSILKETHVSLRPSKERLLSGKSALHPDLFTGESSGSVMTAKHTMIEEEILNLARKMIQANNIAADLTIIPIAQTQVQLSDVLENIKSARAIRLYNLCSLIVKQKDIDTISESDIREYVEELKKRATEFPILQQTITSESETILAALACTHAIAKAIYGDTHAIDHQVRPDQDTQTAVVYCTMALTGTKKFIEFAQKINFYDSDSKLTKPPI